MSWWTQFFPSKPTLEPEQLRRLEAWQALPLPKPDTSFDQGRYVVVDVETSGLNLAKDHLIAIGAIAVREGRIEVSDSLEIVLRQRQISDRDNILIHGIGGTAQSEGTPPVEALLQFLEYLGKDPLVAFHVAFDETMISRALKKHLGLKFEHHWADLAYICPALYPELARRHRALDDWMGRFHITNYARHSALADALSTAELLLAIRGRLEEKGSGSFRLMHDLERSQRRGGWAT